MSEKLEKLEHEKWQKETDCSHTQRKAVAE